MDIPNKERRQDTASGCNSPASGVCYAPGAGGRDGGDYFSEFDLHPGSSIDRSKSRKASGDPTQTSSDESDSTPRSEVPSHSESPSIWQSSAVSHQPQQQSTISTETGYFSPAPIRYPYPGILHSGAPRSATSSTEPSASPGIRASAQSLREIAGSLLGYDKPAFTSLDRERPSILRDLSNSSTASSNTIIAFKPEYTISQKGQRDLPSYPNQAYAALHHQYHPPPSISHQFLRARSSHPTQFTSGLTIETKVDSTHERNRQPHHHESTAKTEGNSPASSPGLFSPNSAKQRPPLDTHNEQGSYSSPYLHYTHRQIPKETHIADVEVDPVSGRKLINNYEVIDELGRGVHGKVKLGRNLETGKFVAIKIVDRYPKRKRLGKNTSHEDKIRQEIAILKKARHDNIVGLLEVIDDPTAKKVYIVLEHVEMGEVRWRTEGPKEIILIEYRRCQREVQGLCDEGVALAEDGMILEVAAKRRERQEKKRVREMYRQRNAVTEHESWSIEHGAETDDDCDESGSISRTSTTSTTIKPSERKSTPSTGILSRDRFKPEVPAQPLEQQKQPEPSSAYASLQGTMYGAYEPEDPRGRTPSVVSSSGSHTSYFAVLDDDSEEIPEHFHHVPLMSLSAARDALRDTVLGLEYLHYQGVIHRDIKPANLLQTKDRRIKISDFGVSYLGRQSHGDGGDDQSESEVDNDEALELAKTVGTPAFYAPELCQMDEDAAPLPVTAQIDVWALGVTLYCLVYGRVPFHAENTFALMRLIAETEVYIPRWRLKAVDEHAGSRPNSHGRYYHQLSSGKRAPHDLEYEGVSEDLRDLIRRLLIKDPRKRMQLKEVKRHPWLLEGIANKIEWVESTDPSRAEARIKISAREVEEAVVSLTILDRMRSGFRKLGVVLGVSTSSSSSSRRRAKSSAMTPSERGALSSTPISGSIFSQEARRPSLRLDESISAVLRNSREPDQGVSRSVNASPASKQSSASTLYTFRDKSSRPGSPMVLSGSVASSNSAMSEFDEHPGPLSARRSIRPLGPERAYSSMSSAASIKTIRQSDLGMMDTATPISPMIPPGLPGTPIALASPGGTNLGGILGGAPLGLLKTVRSRESRLLRPASTNSDRHGRSKSIDRLVMEGSADAHGAPSLALSNATAAGQVDPPALLQEQPTPNSPSLSSKHRKGLSIARSTSTASSNSVRRQSRGAIHDAPTMPAWPPSFAPVAASTMMPTGASEWEASERSARRGKEEHHTKDRSHSGSFPGPSSALSQSPSPPSPDDDIFFRGQRLENYLKGQQASHESSLEASPTSYHQHGSRLTSSSSEGQFTSISQSTSNPSIPSMVSATSSLEEGPSIHTNVKGLGTRASDDTLNLTTPQPPNETDFDNVLESPDNDDDSDEDEDFFVLPAKSKTRQSHIRSGSVSNAELIRHRIRRDTANSGRLSNRSGSNGTVKRTWINGDEVEEEYSEPKERPVSFGV